MKKTYDFSGSVSNPYLSKAKKQLTIRLDQDTVEYFKTLAEKNRIPYQNLMNLHALKKAVSKMDEMLQREGLTETELDELTKDFRAWRKARK